MYLIYRAVIVCAWGERGAAASDKDGQVYTMHGQLVFNGFTVRKSPYKSSLGSNTRDYSLED